MTGRGIRAAIAAAALLVAARAALPVDDALRARTKDADALRRSDAARALGKEGSVDAAALLATLLADPDAQVRDAAVIACGALTAPEAVDAVAKAAASPDERTRRNVAEALGRTRHAAALPHLAAAARKDPSPRVRADALDALWEFPRSADALAVATDAAKDADATVRAAAVEASGRVAAEDAADLVRAALDDADVGVRCVAQRELRIVARHDALARLPEAAKDADWRVRAQTVEDAAWMRDAAAMDVLVALVDDASPRVAHAAVRSLRLLAGRDVGRDRAAWAAWWTEAKPGWRRPKVRAEDETAALAETPAATDGPTYHGLPVESDHVAFVVDASAAMSERVADDGPTRWDVARRELAATLSALSAETRASVLVVADTVRRASDRAGADELLAAAPSGRSNLVGALLAALADDAVDTVYLVTDGTPTAGEVVDRGRVQAAVRQANRTRKVAVHAISIGAVRPTERQFLDGLARDAGGRSVRR